MDGEDRLLSEVEFVAFDLETTGLQPAACQIVEVGALRFRLDGSELGSLEQLVDPQCPIPCAVIRVHGITNAMVCGKPTIDSVLPQLVEFLGSPETILLAHNARFDLGFLTFALARQRVLPPVHAVVDTLALARTCFRRLPSHRLEYLAVELGVADSEEHRALSDSRLVMGVFREIVARNPAVQTVGDLFRLSSPRSLAHAGSTPSPSMVSTEELRLVIDQQRAIVMTYQGATTGIVQRTVTPRTIIQLGSRGYLVAYCHTDGIEKTYRLDRIRAFRVANA